MSAKIAALVRTDSPPQPSYKQMFGVFQYTGRALSLVWTTSRSITVWLALLSAASGALPAALAYVGKLIVDAVVLAARTGGDAERLRALEYVALELSLVVVRAAAERGLGICESLLRALMGQRVNEMILEKALTLSLRDFEDSEFYDRLTRARREASQRPLSLVKRSFGLVQNLISVVVYGGLLLRFSAWTVLVLTLAAVPVFVVETRFSQDAFRLFRWRAPETRMQTYLEGLLAREDNAKEVTLFRLGPLFLGRYRDIFATIFGEDRALTLRRGVYGFVLGLLSTFAFYGAYAFIVLRAALRKITLGDMTMYLLVFKQGQAALSSILSAIGGMYEDNLYLSNLYEFLEHQSPVLTGTKTEGPDPGDGIRFEGVSFAYPGAKTPALRDVTLHIPRGGKLALVGENGAGKTTLIKLLTRLYTPTSGRILLDGLDLAEWEPNALRRRIGVIFQDFIRYQLVVGENIGAGDVDAFDDEARWRRAAEKGMAEPFVEKLPQGFRTQLGKWFFGGHELSVGQWQKIALSRAFMRENADILVLDEPTSAMDAEAEAEVFARFRSLAENRMGIVISHRFSTVRMADEIVVLVAGAVVEQGTHAALMAKNGRYARLFNLQAEGYR
ncbi:MAG TPA: ABC transporter ATP-binding protein [Polyangiaceae bacterium]|nr:ABC transporter ATP-binding protein [Polyangiaceae bacterium]